MKKPTWPEVCALAEKHNVQYSIRELQRFTRDCVFPPDLIALFWPNATPRRLAMVQGQARYIGKLCPRHGTTERFVCNAACVVCQSDHQRSEYHRNPEANKLRSAAWHRENRKYRNVYQQANRQKNREAAA